MSYQGFFPFDQQRHVTHPGSYFESLLILQETQNGLVSFRETAFRGLSLKQFSGQALPSTATISSDCVCFHISPERIEKQIADMALSKTNIVVVLLVGFVNYLEWAVVMTSIYPYILSVSIYSLSGVR